MERVVLYIELNDVLPLYDAARVRAERNRSFHEEEGAIAYRHPRPADKPADTLLLIRLPPPPSTTEIDFLLPALGCAEGVPLESCLGRVDGIFVLDDKASTSLYNV